MKNKKITMKKIIITMFLCISLFSFSNVAMQTELKKADELYKRNYILKAKKIYEKYSKTSNDAKFRLVGYHWKNNDFEEAEKILLTMSNNIDAKKILAKLYIINDREREAENLFDENNPDKILALGDVYSELNNYQYYDNLLMFDFRDDEGNLYGNANYTEKAKSRYTEAYQKGSKTAYYRLIKSYGNVKSIMMFEALKGNLDNELNKLVGEELYESENYADAVEYYKLYLEKTKGNEKIFMAFLKFHEESYGDKKDLENDLLPYIKRGDEGAKTTLNKFGKRNEDEIYYDIYDELYNAKKFEDKEKIYLKAIKAGQSYETDLLMLYNKNNEKKYNDYLNTLIRDGFYIDDIEVLGDKAEEIYQNYVNQGIKKANYKLIDIYENEKKYQEAALLIEKMGSKTNSLRDIINTMNIYNKAEKYQEVIKIQIPENYDHEYDEYYKEEFDFYKAYAYYKFGEYKKAEEILLTIEDFITYDDFYYTSKVYLLDIYSKTGNQIKHREMNDKIYNSFTDMYFIGNEDIKNSLKYYSSIKDEENYKKLFDKYEKEIQKINKNSYSDLIFNFILILPIDINALIMFSEEDFIEELKYDSYDYDSIKKDLEKTLFKVDNSKENAKEYIQSLRVMGLYTMKVLNEKNKYVESKKTDLSNYTKEDLRNRFIQHYSKLYKNKNGVSFYPNLDDNLLYPIFMEKLGIKEIAPANQTQEEQKLKSLLGLIMIGYFAEKYEFNEEKLNAILPNIIPSGESDIEALNVIFSDFFNEKKSKKIMDEDFEEMYALLNTYFVNDVVKRLEKSGRAEEKKKLEEEFSDYLTPEKISKMEKILNNQDSSFMQEFFK